MPFLRNVVFGRGVPDERLAAVEHHYLDVGGRSPYNELTERLRAGVERGCARRASTCRSTAACATGTRTSRT